MYLVESGIFRCRSIIRPPGISYRDRKREIAGFSRVFDSKMKKKKKRKRNLAPRLLIVYDESMSNLWFCMHIYIKFLKHKRWNNGETKKKQQKKKEKNIYTSERITFCLVNSLKVMQSIREREEGSALLKSGMTPCE